MSGPARPLEERSYLGFMAAGLALALGAGLVLGLMVPLSPALGWGLDVAALVRAHAQLQLAGWLGLVAAGMALRLVPRLVHRRPLPGALSAAVLALLASGAVLRPAGELGAGTTVLVAGSALAGAGTMATGAALAWTLARCTAERASWRLPAWAAAGWWLVWGLLTLASAAGPASLGIAWQRAAILGAIGNLIWAIQARTVPAFHGRRPPRLGAPVALYNLGTALSLAVGTGAGRAGLALAGAGLLWLAPSAGAVWGRAHRLRAPSRAPARFIVAANIWAMAAGACLLAGAAAPAVAGRLDDAGLHLLGLGLATTLIVAAALGHGAIPAPAYEGLVEAAGLATWAALALFAGGFARALALQGRRRRALVRSARPGPPETEETRPGDEEAPPEGGRNADHGVVERGTRRVWDRVAGLDAGWFGLVMATGILSTATLEMGMAWATTPLLAVAAAAYVALCALTGCRLVVAPRRVLADAAAPDRAFTLFAFVAASDVLGLRLIAAGQVPVAAALAALAAAAWLLLSYAIPLMLISAPRRPGAAATADGSWLLWVVGTQSVATAAATFAVLDPAARGGLALVAIALWGFAAVLYVLLMALIVHRLLLRPLAPAQLTPPYWITMGATAITVFAAARILNVPGPLPLSRQALGALALVLWAFGTWWFPLLVLLGVWRHLVRRVPLSYEPALWSLVFPLGMYAAASHAFGAAAGIGALEVVARVEVWPGLAAWAAVFASMVAAGLRAGRG